MKTLFLLCLLGVTSAAVHAQSYTNPDTIQQKGDIILQNTDVYYKPFAPPGPMDTRKNLCNISTIYNDPNGVGNGNYWPMIYDAVSHGFIRLSNWSPPCDSGNVLGENVCWQRLFQAMNKPDGTPSDIVAGGGAPGTRVTVSANEDVDFRASGRIKLKSGFHVKPGAFFHAYTEPKWDTAVFSDEFDSAAKFNNQWHIGKGWGDINAGAECSSDSNVYLDTDYQAHDGHALDIILREAPNDTCTCNHIAYGVAVPDSCDGTNQQDTTHPSFAFSSAMVRSCPFPYTTTSGILGATTYAHAPYGKYEFRDKIPHTLHHTNNWGGTGDMEFDINETQNVTMGRICPDWDHNFRYGPYMGFFKKELTDTLFICHTAGWGTHVLNPQTIIIDNFLYRVMLDTSTAKDTVVARDQTVYAGGFPASIVNRTDSFPFYFEATNVRRADATTWTVDTDSHGTWRIFSAPYQDSLGTHLLFSKNYQPTSLTLTIDTGFLTGHVTKSFNCHWLDSLNEPSNTGRIWLDDTMAPGDLHSFTEAFQYTVFDMYGGLNYPFPNVIIDRDTATHNYPPNYYMDTAAYAHTPYRYHTFAMEFLPHEVRYLIDSVVVRRIPDRLVPRGSPYYDWVTTEARSGAYLYPAEIDIDYNTSDPFGKHAGVDANGNDSSVTYLERHYFETHTGNPGFWPVTIGGHSYPAAHHLIDYVKVWDVPKDVKIPGYPQ